MTQLDPHQVTAVDFLTSRGFACLWDDPGVGKTPPTVVATAAMFPRRALVFAPAAVRQHWAREFATWAPSLPCHVEEGYFKAPPREGVTIASHANLASEAVCAHIIAGAPYEVIVIDEADAFKVYTAKRTRHMMSPSVISQSMPFGIWKYARHLWCLTGTPLVNSAGDLYPMINGPMRMNVSWWDFCGRYAVLVPDASTGWKATSIQNTAELANVLRPSVLRRTVASLNMQLPSLTIENITLPVRTEDMLRAMSGLEGWTEAQFIKALDEDDELRDPEISRVRHALGLAKAPAAAAEMRAQLDNEQGPLVTFFQHTAVRDVFKDLVIGAKIGVIDGKTTRNKINAAVQAFQQRELDLLLVQTQAGGMGLTLTASNVANVTEIPWTATALKQALARIHRKTQTRDCFAKVMRAENCWLEDAMAKTVGKKQKASAELLGFLTTSE